MTTPRDIDPRIDAACMASLMDAVQKYFDLMYDCDTSRFAEVFYTTVHLHGFREGGMQSWSAATYKDILDRRTSPKSQNAARQDDVLLVDFASPTQALTKVQVLISSMRFTDHLTWHRIDGRWLVTSKGFHLHIDGLESST